MKGLTLSWVINKELINPQVAPAAIAPTTAIGSGNPA